MGTGVALELWHAGLHRLVLLECARPRAIRRLVVRGAPAIGIAQFEGIYYWTLGGDDQWLLDDNQNKIPVAGQNGKTPTINKDGYWEIDGETGAESK